MSDVRVWLLRRLSASGPGTACGLLGAGAAGCVLLCAEAPIFLATVGGGEMVAGADIGAFNYGDYPGPHNFGGYVKAAIIGTVENGPYPIESLFGNGGN
jgi:hypothetical protein